MYNISLTQMTYSIIIELVIQNTKGSHELVK